MSNPALSLPVALGIGLLLGVERERHKGRGPERGPAGIRTFALVALLGGLSYRVGGVAVTAVALAVVGLAAVAGYLVSTDQDPGLTTEIALLVDFLLGALTQRNTALAAGLAVGTAILLAGRELLGRARARHASSVAGSSTTGCCSPPVHSSCCRSFPIMG